MRRNNSSVFGRDTRRGEGTTMEAVVWNKKITEHECSLLMALRLSKNAVRKKSTIQCPYHQSWDLHCYISMGGGRCWCTALSVLYTRSLRSAERGGRRTKKTTTVSLENGWRQPRAISCEISATKNSTCSISTACLSPLGFTHFMAPGVVSHFP